MEYGVETTKEETLLAINRGHTFEESKETILKTNCWDTSRGTPDYRLAQRDKERLVHPRTKYCRTTRHLHQITPATDIKRNDHGAKKGLQSPERFHLLSADEYIEILGELLPHDPRYHLFRPVCVTSASPFTFSTQLANSLKTTSLLTSY